MSDKIGAVITGGDFQGLGILRSLAKKNIPIVLLDSEHCISRYSRFRKRFIKSPHPSEAETYGNFLMDLAEREKINGWVILPNSDEAVYVLSKYKESLEKFYKIPTPCWEITQYVYDKAKTYQLAEKHGISIPKTYYPQDLSGLRALDLEFPLVIKPSIRPNFYNKVKIKAFRINNRNELIKTYQWVSSIIDPSEILVQEFLPGGPANLYSFCPFFKDGKVLMSVTARRARQHPMDFGHASTFVELVDVPEMQRIAETFLKLVDYYGIAEVEFMRDPRDDKYKLIEVNPRFWGWHTLAIGAGVDFPYVLYQDLIGEEVHVPTALRQLKWIRLTTDIPTVFLEIIKGRMKVADYITSMKGKKEYAVFAVDDPIPFIAEILMIPYLWMKRGF